MVNLEWYRTFKAVYQQGNMTKAALDLQISQPNVSVHLAALENHVGGKLFKRVSKGLIPTDLGKDLYVQVTEAVQKLESVELNYRKSQLEEFSTIRLGVPHEYFDINISPKIKDFTSRIITKFGTTNDLLVLLENGELDFVVATQQLSNKYVAYEYLETESFVVIGSKDIDSSPFVASIERGDSINAETWLLSQNWYVYSSDLAFVRRFWINNFKKRPLINPKYIIPDLNLIIKSISLGNGISIIPEYLATRLLENNEIVKIWDGFIPTTNDLFLAYNEKKVSVAKIEEMKKILF